MTSKMISVVALIPLRGGSKSIPNKNIKSIAGQPLCAWVINAAIKAKEIDKVIVSTDSPEIKQVVRQISSEVEVLDRPPEFATDEATTESVMQDFTERVDFEILVTIQATSPMLTAADLDAALIAFRKSDYDSMLSAVRTKRFFWNDNRTPINYDPFSRPRRQDFSGTLMENGAFYITKHTIFKDCKCRLGGRIGIHEMHESSAVEIDEPEDWPIVEDILQKQKKLNIKIYF